MALHYNGFLLHYFSGPNEVITCAPKRKCKVSKSSTLNDITDIINSNASRCQEKEMKVDSTKVEVEDINVQGMMELSDDYEAGNLSEKNFCSNGPTEIEVEITGETI